MSLPFLQRCSFDGRGWTLWSASETARESPVTCFHQSLLLKTGAPASQRHPLTQTISKFQKFLLSISLTIDLSKRLQFEINLTEYVFSQWRSADSSAAPPAPIKTTTLPQTPHPQFKTHSPHPSHQLPQTPKPFRASKALSPNKPTSATQSN